MKVLARLHLQTENDYHGWALGCFTFEKRGVDALRSRACSITFFSRADSTRWPQSLHLVEGVHLAGDSSERGVAR